MMLMLLKQYWKQIGIILVVICVGVAIKAHFSNDRQLKADLASSMQTIATLRASIDLQNATILQAKKDGDELKVKAAAAQAEAAKAAAKLVVKARTTLTEKPSDPNDLCRSANELMNSHIADLNGE